MYVNDSINWNLILYEVQAYIYKTQTYMSIQKDVILIPIEGIQWYQLKITKIRSSV